MGSGGHGTSPDPPPAEPLRAGEYTLSPIPPEEGPALGALFEQCVDYFELVTGLPPGPGDAQSTFMALPEGKSYDDKFLLGGAPAARSTGPSRAGW